MKWIKPIALLLLGFAIWGLMMSNIFVNNDESDVLISTSKSETDLVWHDIREIDELVRNTDKLVIVDIYTDWCKWCKVMDEKTFSDPGLIYFLDESFHMVKFNAEERSTIKFDGKKYEFVKRGKRGYNKLAAELCKGDLAYPSFVVLDNKLNVVDVIRGFKDAKQFRSYLESVVL
jgi:thioredoxin-related protein